MPHQFIYFVQCIEGRIPTHLQQQSDSFQESVLTPVMMDFHIKPDRVVPPSQYFDSQDPSEDAYQSIWYQRNGSHKLEIN
ncbi:hypothetical protein KL938_004408 [Ogataea parapolymorpha]|nr:hypothetical protein KL938_004408 [Ogataea parapolymorpha]